MTSEAEIADVAARALFAVKYPGEEWDEQPLDYLLGLRKQAAAAIKAARPHLPEAKALERVRALCDEWALHQHAFKPPGQLSLDAAYAARKLRSAIGASHDE